MKTFYYNALTAIADEAFMVRADATDCRDSGGEAELDDAIHGMEVHLSAAANALKQLKEARKNDR